MTFYYLDGVQISEACAYRWDQLGLIALAEVVHHETVTEMHYTAGA